MVNRERRNEIIERSHREAEDAKMHLIDIMHQLEEAGAIRQSKSLETIIIRLEEWQNK